MNCEEHQQQVSKLLDNALEKNKTADVFDHLGGCERCREFFEATLHIRRALLSSAPLASGNQAEISGVHSPFVDRAPVPRATRRLSFRLRTAALLALLVLAAGLFWSTTLPKQSDDRFHPLGEAPQNEMPNFQP